ncbi:hypothetical protein [Planctomycetes bacterium CA13]
MRPNNFYSAMDRGMVPLSNWMMPPMPPPLMSPIAPQRLQPSPALEPSLAENEESKEGESKEEESKEVDESSDEDKQAAADTDTDESAEEADIEAANTEPSTDDEPEEAEEMPSVLETRLSAPLNGELSITIPRPQIHLSEIPRSPVVVKLQSPVPVKRPTRLPMALPPTPKPQGGDVTVPVRHASREKPRRLPSVN